MREAIRDLGIAPDVVLVSSARRTLQTLDALAPWDETPIIEPLDSLYLAPAPALLQTLRGVAPTVRSLLVIGHNPGLHDLALTLVGAHAMSADGHDARRLAQGFPPGALAEFTIAADWSALDEAGGSLVRFLAPSDLSEMAQ